MLIFRGVGVIFQYSLGYNMYICEHIYISYISDYSSIVRYDRLKIHMTYYKSQILGVFCFHDLGIDLGVSGLGQFITRRSRKGNLKKKTSPTNFRCLFQGSFRTVFFGDLHSRASKGCLQKKQDIKEIQFGDWWTSDSLGDRKDSESKLLKFLDIQKVKSAWIEDHKFYQTV